MRVMHKCFERSRKNTKYYTKFTGRIKDSDFYAERLMISLLLNLQKSLLLIGSVLDRRPLGLIEKSEYMYYNQLMQKEA